MDGRQSPRQAAYAAYLESDVWSAIRTRIFKRDSYKCRACREPAEIVHHARYPLVFGEEKDAWLYALCRSCHGEIHAIEDTAGLYDATLLVLGIKPDAKVTVLPDDWQLSKSATRKRARKSKYRKAKKKPHK